MRVRSGEIFCDSAEQVRQVVLLCFTQQQQCNATSNPEKGRLKEEEKEEDRRSNMFLFSIFFSLTHHLLLLSRPGCAPPPCIRCLAALLLAKPLLK